MKKAKYGYRENLSGFRVPRTIPVAVRPTGRRVALTEDGDLVSVRYFDSFNDTIVLQIELDGSCCASGRRIPKGKRVIIYADILETSNEPFKGKRVGGVVGQFESRLGWNPLA